MRPHSCWTFMFQTLACITWASNIPSSNVIFILFQSKLNKLQNSSIKFCSNVLVTINSVIHPLSIFRYFHCWCNLVVLARKAIYKRNGSRTWWFWESDLVKIYKFSFKFRRILLRWEVAIQIWEGESLRCSWEVESGKRLRFKIVMEKVVI